MINRKTNNNFEIKTKTPLSVLPEFSRIYDEISSFQVQFNDLIINNIQMSLSQKVNFDLV